MSVVAIIPARGGSKRIPRKNIKEFCGQPIIAYSINAAKNAGIFDRILVDTDDEEIAEIAKEYGAEVPYMRDKNLADDQTPMVISMKNYLIKLRENGENVEFATCIYATAPFVRSKELKEGYNLISNKKSAVAVGVTSFPYCVFRGMVISEDETNIMQMKWPENALKRSQDFPEMYHDTGQFLWMYVDRFISEDFSFNGAQAVFTPRYLVQDIDTLEDWERAEIMYKALNNK